MDIRATAGNAPQSAAPAALNQKGLSPTAGSAGIGAVAAPQAEPPALSAEQVSQAIKNINSALEVRSQDIEFSIDSESARTIVTVKDKNTHEIIRQMPTKEAMEIAKALDRLQGLLIKQTA